MLMKDDKKKAVTLIMGKMLGKPEETQEAPSKDGTEQDDSVAVDTAAEELISAIEAKSPKGVVMAIKSLMELCQQESEDYEESEEKSEV